MIYANGWFEKKVLFCYVPQRSNFTMTDFIRISNSDEIRKSSWSILLNLTTKPNMNAVMENLVLIQHFPKIDLFLWIVNIFFLNFPILSENEITNYYVQTNKLLIRTLATFMTYIWNIWLKNWCCDCDKWFYGSNLDKTMVANVGSCPWNSFPYQGNNGGSVFAYQ